MPNSIYLGVPSSTSGNLTACLMGIGLAGTNGYDGVITDASMVSYGDPTSVPVTYIEQAADKAVEQDVDLCILLGFGYKPTDPYMVALNGSILTVRNRPPEVCWDAVVSIGQQLLDAAYARYVTTGGKAASRFRVILFNEPSKGGVGGPHSGNLSDGVYVSPYDTQLSGEIEADFWTYARYVAENTVFPAGIEIIGVTFVAESNSDGSMTTAGQREIDSCTGADFVAFNALVDRNGCNCYAPAKGSSSAMVTAWSARAQGKRTAFVANADVASVPFDFIKEAGVHKGEQPACTSANTVRQLVLNQAKVEANYTAVGMFISSATGVANKDEAMWDADGNPFDGVTVAP